MVPAPAPISVVPSIKLPIALRRLWVFVDELFWAASEETSLRNDGLLVFPRSLERDNWPLTEIPCRVPARATLGRSAIDGLPQFGCRLTGYENVKMPSQEAVNTGWWLECCAHVTEMVGRKFCQRWLADLPTTDDLHFAGLARSSPSYSAVFDNEGVLVLFTHSYLATSLESFSTCHQRAIYWCVDY